jgi:hypothetical protein
MNTNRHEWFFDRINGINGIIATEGTEVEPPVSDCIRPVLQAKPVLEINFCAELDLYYSVSDETGGMFE